MSLHRKRQAVGVHVWLQRPIDLTDKGRQGLITHLDPRSTQHRADYYPPYEEFGRRKARDSFLTAHAHIVEPCVLEHCLESLGTTKTIDSVHQSCSLSTDVSLEPSSQGMMPRTALNGAPHSDSEATAWNEHAVRLS
jgi:hypothetical protein